jgi:hypothetical protein
MKFFYIPRRPLSILYLRFNIWRRGLSFTRLTKARRAFTSSPERDPSFQRRAKARQSLTSSPRRALSFTRLTKTRSELLSPLWTNFLTSFSGYISCATITYARRVLFSAGSKSTQLICVQVNQKLFPARATRTPSLLSSKNHFFPFAPSPTIPSSSLLLSSALACAFQSFSAPSPRAHWCSAASLTIDNHRSRHGAAAKSLVFLWKVALVLSAWRRAGT